MILVVGHSWPARVRRDWINPGWRFGPYGVVKTGFASYEVAEEGNADHYIRPLYLGRFFRWKSAARVAQALFIARRNGAGEVAAFGLDGVKPD